jgi:hypothetical protein
VEMKSELEFMKAAVLFVLMIIGTSSSIRAQTTDDANGVQPLIKGDSLALFIPLKNLTAQDKKIHLLIWSIAEVREAAKYLKTKDVKTLTMFDKKPDADSEYYVVAFYEYLHDHIVRLDTYRVSKNNKIEKLVDLNNDKWSALH